MLESCLGNVWEVKSFMTRQCLGHQEPHSLVVFGPLKLVVMIQRK